MKGTQRRRGIWRIRITRGTPFRRGVLKECRRDAPRRWLNRSVDTRDRGINIVRSHGESSGRYGRPPPCRRHRRENTRRNEIPAREGFRRLTSNYTHTFVSSVTTEAEKKAKIFVNYYF